MKITTNVLIFQIIYIVQSKHLYIYILLGNSKREASIPSNNDSFNIGMIFLYIC